METAILLGAYILFFFFNTLMSLQLISVTYYLNDINIYLRRIEMSSEQFLAYAQARKLNLSS